MRIRHYNDIKLKNKLFITYFGIFMLFFIAISSVVFNTTTSIINNSIENHLLDQADRIKDAVEVAADTSIRNHLRTISEINYQLCEYYYAQYKNGLMTESEAQTNVKRLLSAQKIGDSGYVYILNSEGILLHHSEVSLIGSDISDYDFVKNQTLLKNGYIEYNWKNPEDLSARPKSLYMSYFQPWDWILSASSYKEEFSKLVNIQDFKAKILDIQFGESGYVTVLDNSGRFLIHPSFEGRNLIEENHPQGSIVKKFIDIRSGYYEYDWQNSNELSPRTKISVVSEIPEYGWLVAATSYKEEFYKDIERIRSLLITIGVICAIILLVITYLSSTSITKPLRRIEQIILKGASGDLTARVHLDQKDEIGDIGRYFNQFLESLQRQETALKDEILERIQAEANLELLNEHLEELVEARTQALNQSLETLKQTQGDLVRSERYLALGSIVANVGHHLNTPLGSALTTSTFMTNSISILTERYENKNLTASALANYISEMNDANTLLVYSLKHAIELVETFKLLKTSDFNMPIERFELVEMLNLIKEEFQQLYHNRAIKFFMYTQEPIYLDGYKDIYDMIIRQLLSNATVHGLAGQQDGIVQIDVAVIDDQVSLTISDNGNGISEERLLHIFEPFYASDGSIGSGTLGLGLNLVYKSVVEVLSGTINIESQESVGTKVIIQFPRISSS